MDEKSLLQEYLVNSKAPKAVLNAMRDLDEAYQKEMADADMFRKSLVARDMEVLRLEELNTELKNAVDFWLNAWRDVRKVLIQARNWSALWKQAAKLHHKFGLQMSERVESAEQQMHDETIADYNPYLLTGEELRHTEEWHNRK